MENKKLESLVPPPELCKQIPDGEFADSALVWVIKPEVAPEVWERAKAQNLPNTWKTFPAPTLAETLDAIDAIGYHNTTTAALKLWLEVEGRE